MDITLRFFAYYRRNIAFDKDIFDKKYNIFFIWYYCIYFYAIINLNKIFVRKIQMLFNSIDFLLFFPVVIMIYYIVPVRQRYLWLLVVSYYFYLSWNVKYMVYLLPISFATYILGLALEQIETSGLDEKGKKAYQKNHNYIWYYRYYRNIRRFKVYRFFHN